MVIRGLVILMMPGICGVNSRPPCFTQGGDYVGIGSRE